MSGHILALTMKCADCRFYEAPKGGYENLARGSCRRHAPIPRAVEEKIVAKLVASWPPVLPSDGCGEFARRSEHQETQ